MPKKELQPVSCPLCSEAPAIERRQHNPYTVTIAVACVGCNVQGKQFMEGRRYSESFAIKDWNERAVQT